MEKVASLFNRNRSNMYFLSRVLVGFLFFQHGAQKLFGWFGAESAAPFMSQFWIGGVFEILGGLAVALGLLTKLASFLSAVYILIVYFMFHASNLTFPVQQVGGELALLYFAAFLLIGLNGPGKWALDKVLKIKLQ